MKSIVVEGQISLFETPPSVYNNVIEVKKEKKDNPVFKELIEQYKDKCTRIAKVEKKLYVEIGGQTLSFEPTGEAAGIFIKDMLLRPKDEILISNEYKPINEKQIKTLNRFTDIDKVIKRRSDNNILIQYDNFCMAIYPSGHFAKWKSPAVYKDNEVYSIEEIKNINKFYEIKAKDPVADKINDEGELHLGDKVKFDYAGPQVGEIVRIYNKGETVNVCWDNKQTAFYYKSVVKINA